MTYWSTASNEFELLTSDVDVAAQRASVLRTSAGNAASMPTSVATLDVLGTNAGELAMVRIRVGRRPPDVGRRARPLVSEAYDTWPVPRNP